MTDGSAGRLSEVLRPVRRALDLLIPPCCVLCSTTLEADEPPVCPVCWHRLPRILHPRCERCGATRLTPAERGGCAACAAWPVGTLLTASAYRMCDDAARLLRFLKYAGWAALGRQMGSALSRPATELAERAGVSLDRILLVPVPIAPARLRERGFNQAELLAFGLGAAVGAETRPLLRRARTDQAQAKLARSERMANVRGRFHAEGSASAPGTSVLLVDDVVTTGATATACASSLDAAGLVPIGLVSFARAWETLEPGGNSPVGM